MECQRNAQSATNPAVRMVHRRSDAVMGRALSGLIDVACCSLFSFNRLAGIDQLGCASRCRRRSANSVIQQAVRDVLRRRQGSCAEMIFEAKAAFDAGTEQLWH